MLSSLFPQWMPPWAQAALLVGGMLFALVWLLVPFAVFGVKGRLDNLAVQLDDLQAQLRVMAMGLNSAPPAAGETLPDMLDPRPSMQVSPASSVPVWEPETPRGGPVPVTPDRDGAEEERDIPAYERRAARVQPQPPAATPQRPVQPDPVRTRQYGEVERDDWSPQPPRPARPYVPRPPEAELPAGGQDNRRGDHGPSLSEWSRNGRAESGPVATNRPVRASVWPPERRLRTEPTLRWPPRAD